MRFNNAISLLRFRNWFYLLGIPLLAITQNQADMQSGKVFSLLVFSSIYFCWGYVFNNLFDKHEDPTSKNSFKFAPPKYSIAVTVFLQFLLIISAAVNHLLLATIGIIVLNGVYSAPPLRLKRFLPATLLLNGFFFSFPYLTSVEILKGSMDNKNLEYGFFVFLLFLPLQYVHFLEHREEDGKKNSKPWRISSLLLFLMPCLYVAQVEELRDIAFGTILYSCFCFLFLVRIESAKKVRVWIRTASLALGAYLLLTSIRHF